MVITIWNLVTYTVGVVESTVSVEFTFVELALVDNTIGELEFSDALGPIVFLGAREVTSRPLGHFSLFAILI